jgi:ribosomal protein S18 acetylase RimI-like enzyme
VIRNATLSDIPAVLALWASARSGHAETPDTHQSLARLLDTDPGALLVYEDAEGLWRSVGYRDDVEIGRWVRSLP